MEKKQTPVEYYRKGMLQLNVYIADHKIDVSEFESVEAELFEKAKQMEKEQQKYFFDCGRQYQLNGEGTFKQVHNETYGETKN